MTLERLLVSLLLPVPLTCEILILVSTSPASFAKRVTEIRETWLKTVEPGMEVVFMSNTATDGSSDMVLSQCPTDVCINTCKQSDLVFFAQTFLKSRPVGSWLLFLDDDVYVVPRNLMRMIRSLPAGAENDIGLWGIPACGSSTCGGMCGGGGYLTNRITLDVLIGGMSPDTFKGEIMSLCQVCRGYGDISVSQLAKNSGIPLKYYPSGTLLIWERTDEEIRQIVMETENNLWLIHYSSRGSMREIHVLVEEYLNRE
jgi:hypothetical protein